MSTSTAKELHHKTCRILYSMPNLDKWAQLDHDQVKDIFKAGKSTANKEELLKFASQKFISSKILYPLVYNELQSPLHETYRNTLNCGNNIRVEGGRIEKFSCKNRFCVNCSRKRTADLITDYKPVVDTWKKTQFVTLTIPNVNGSNLTQSVEQMNKTFSLIIRRLKRKFNGKIQAIRKLEITYSFRFKTYHPHLHIIVENRKFGLAIIKEWLKMNKGAKIQAQDIRTATEGAIIELFKYFTKIFKFHKHTKKIEVYPPAVMDRIFCSMAGKRMIQTYGFIKKDYAPKNETEYLEKNAIQLAEKIYKATENLKLNNVIDGVYKYIPGLKDWFHTEQGHALTNYKAPADTKEWFIQNFDEESAHFLYGFEESAEIVKTEILTEIADNYKTIDKIKYGKWAQMRLTYN